jgi:GT2 family glycosyltransferase
MCDKVYIIIINYTKYQDTIECLESIFKSSYKNFQLLVVDNSPDDISSNNIIKWLNNDYKQVETSMEELVYPLINKPVPYIYTTENEIKNSFSVYDESVILIKATNNGFAAANNVALSYVANIADGSSYVWVLNNDTVIDKAAIQALVNYYKDQPDDLYLITSKLLSYHKKNTFQAVMGNYNKWSGSSYHIGDGEEDKGQYDDYEATDNNYIVGASMFMPHEFIKDAGLMSEEYFLYFEDLDWSRQAKKSGYKLALQPLAKVYHKEGGTNIVISGKKPNKDIGGYYTLVNRIKFTKKWYPGCTVTISAGVIYGLIRRLFQGKFKLVGKAVKAIINSNSVIRYIP